MRKGSLLSTCFLCLVLRDKDFIYNVNNTISSADIRFDHVRFVDEYLSVLQFEPHLLIGNCLNLAGLYVLALHFSGNNMICENFGQLISVFRL